MFRRLLCALALLTIAGAVVSAEDSIPSAAEVSKLVADEPLSADNWPTWRKRLTDWFGDASRNTDPAFQMAYAFFNEQAQPSGDLPAVFEKDALAWYLLGNSYMYGVDRKRQVPPDLDKAEKAYLRSKALDSSFARVYRNLATIDVARHRPGDMLLDAAQQKLTTAATYDRKLDLSVSFGQVALAKKAWLRAEEHFRTALEKTPDDVGAAEGLFFALLGAPGSKIPRKEAQSLADRFPSDGRIAALNGVALAVDNDLRGCVREWNRAEALGVAPEKMFSPDLVQKIRSEAQPGLLDWTLWIMAAFAAFYAAVMAAMFLGGVLLAARTRGAKALDLLESGDAASYLQHGKIARAQNESFLTRLYAFSLFLGLVLFYLAIPFVLAGLLAGTVILLWLIFMLQRVPIKAVLGIVVIGGGAIWAVLKSLFARPASGAFGVRKPRIDLPKLYTLLDDVAGRVDTQPVDIVYLAPGSSIGVHQEGSGPFGIFGVNQRVLTLGMSTLRFLTVGELRAILAHEYAHFSHSDTFYSRFIYQVHLSIGAALDGMAATGGYFNYVNPFYWFLVLYYRCYSVLSAGYSRSREFLADRMASFLFGADVFESALTKVCTDGALFEKTMYDHMDGLLAEQKALVNMYQTFHEYRDQDISKESRDEILEKLRSERESLFASHPTYAERIEAIANLPSAQSPDPAAAISLFEEPEKTEGELTVFMTDYLAYLQDLRVQAAAARAAR